MATSVLAQLLTHPTIPWRCKLEKTCPCKLMPLWEQVFILIFPQKTKTQCCSEGRSQGKDGKLFLMKSHFSTSRLTVRKANLPCIRKIEDRTSGMSHHRAPLTGSPTWPHSHKLWVVYEDLLLKIGMRPIMGRKIPLKIHWPQHHVELGGWSQPPVPAELFGALPHWLRNARKVWLSATFLSWRFAWTLRQGHPVAGHLE